MTFTARAGNLNQSELEFMNIFESKAPPFLI